MALTATKWENRLLLDPGALTWVKVDIDKLLVDPSLSEGKAYFVNEKLFIENLNIISVSFEAKGKTNLDVKTKKNADFFLTLTFSDSTIEVSGNATI